LIIISFKTTNNHLSSEAYTYSHHWFKIHTSISSVLNHLLITALPWVYVMMFSTWHCIMRQCPR